MTGHYNSPRLIAIVHLLSVMMTQAASENASEKPRVITMPLVPHHVQRQRRLDAADPFDLKTDALYQGYGTHYVDLWVGTPPQRQTLIVDTGSSVTAFPCHDCYQCGSGYHTDENFQEVDSTTFAPVECSGCNLGTCSGSDQCELSVAYQEGSSWNAFEAVDTVYVGGPHDGAVEGDPDSFKLRFGCQTHLTGLFKTQLADGISGMEINASSLWKQAYDTGVIHSKAFSLCFSRQILASREGTAAGVMTLGGSDTRLHATTMVYARQPNANGWFKVRIQAIYLRVGGGESVLSTNSENSKVERVKGLTEEQINNGDVILDSGTTDTYLSMDIARPFMETYKALMNGEDWDSDTPISLTEEELLRMPTILFQLEGVGEDGSAIDPMAQGLAGAVDSSRPHDVLIAVPPTHYMEYSAKTQLYTPRLYFTESFGGVLGANFMMGHEIFFDVDNKQVGFAESECDYKAVSAVEDSGRE